MRAAARPRIPRAFEAAGTTSFSIIQAASDAGNPDALIFFLFDLLHLDGEAIGEHIIGENLLGPGVQRDDELLDYAGSNGSTVYHASCSCMMGNHGMPVVDDQLRVHGIEALRIIDASVMPAVSSTNTNAPTIMIAEKGAAMIKASAREKLAA